jgi:thiamine biosynthesis lipoprotein
MATTFEIALPYNTPHAVAAAEAALDVIDAVEDQLTIYRTTSEVAQLNCTGSAVVTPTLLTLLQDCNQLTRLTDGTFDVASGALSEVWGFTRREGRIPTPQELRQARACSGMRHVILDAESSTVKFTRPGLKLNFGAIGKGYALDRAARELQRWGIRSALLHGGGSSVYALGTPPGIERGWAVSLQHPANDGRGLGVMHLRNEGMGTSAATFQHFEYAGRRYGHVIDPRRGVPAETLHSATCVASSAAHADALSTAMFVAGAAWSRQFLSEHTSLTAVLYDGTVDVDVVNCAASRYDNST